MRLCNDCWRVRVRSPPSTITCWTSSPACSLSTSGPMTMPESSLRASRRRSRTPISSRAETVFRALLVGVAALIFTMSAHAQTSGTPLHLEAKIPLGAVSGRIDHLAIDLKRQRLFVAELGNDTIGVVNLAARKMQSTMFGPKEPQGIAYEPSTDTVYVAHAGDGSVRVLRADDLTLLQRIDLGDDADNVRI